MTGKDRERILALKKRQQEELDALKKKIRDEEEENRRKKAMEKTVQECSYRWGNELVGLLIESRGKDKWYSSPAEEMEAEVDTLLKSGLVYVEFLKTLFGDGWREIEHPDMLLKKFTNMHPGEEPNGTAFRNLRQRWETTDEFKELKRQDEARARQKAIEDERKAAAKARRKERRDAAKRKEEASSLSAPPRQQEQEQ